MAPGEDASSWGEIFRGLIERGLDPSEVVCVTSDDHLGLREALQRYFPHAAWQRCQAHYQQNAGSRVPRRDRAEVHVQLRDVFAAPDHDETQRRASEMVDQWDHRVPVFAEWLEETIEQTLNVFHLPTWHRVRLRTTNNLEEVPSGSQAPDTGGTDLSQPAELPAPRHGAGNREIRGMDDWLSVSNDDPNRDGLRT